MALAMALSLAGLNKDDFRGIMALLAPIEMDRKSLPDISRTTSPSTQSESSGISSLPLSRGSNGSIGSSNDGTPSLSPISSRPETPTTDENSKASKTGNNSLRVFYEKRDILNLAGNLKDPSWQIMSPTMPREDVKLFAANKSVYHRLGVDALEEDYPVRLCRDCGFTEPSPYLFEDS